MDYSNLPPGTREDLESRGLPENADDKATETWVRENLSGLANLFDFITVVYDESDRGSVICATAFIDNALERAIRSFLKEMSNAPKSILDQLLTKRPLPPLGSYAIRSKMARALGIIDSKTLVGLDSMRPMRNDAAHLAEPFSFDNYNIKSLFEPLSHKEQVYLKALHLVREEDPERFPPLRRLFEIAACSIYYRLNNIAEDPSLYAAAFKVGGHLRHSGPFDSYYDRLMGHSGPESGSSDDSSSSAQT